MPSWVNVANLKGATGSPGPTAVSTDSGNQATLGSDSLIYVPATAWSSITSIPPYVPALAQVSLLGANFANFRGFSAREAA